MSKTVSITVAKRDALGTANARRIRRAGQIPAVIYGHGNEATAITVTVPDAEKVTTHTGLVEILADGTDKKLAIVKEVQRHPINPGIVHIDFLEVRMDEIITSIVPIVSEGEPVGLKQGGQLEQVLMEIEVKSLPTDMPEVITVDVSELDLDQTLRVSELVMPKGVTPVPEPNLIVFQVRLPKQEEPETEETTEGTEGEGADTAAPADGAAAPAADAAAAKGGKAAPKEKK